MHLAFNLDLITVFGDSSVSNFKMINNSFAWITGLNPSNETMKILYNKSSAGEPLNYVEPNNPNSKAKEYYWFGGGFVNQEDGNSMNIFGYRTFDNSSASWDFEVSPYIKAAFFLAGDRGVS